MSGTGEPAKRPRQVTAAAVVAAVACGLLVASLFDAMASVRSVETQDAVRAFLDRQSGLGISVANVIVFLRGLVLASGALAAAGLVMAVYTLRRHRAARIGLTVVALLMLFTTTFVRGLLPVVIAAASSMLWSREAREWFDGRDHDRSRAPGGAGSRPDPFARPVLQPPPAGSVEAPAASPEAGGSPVDYPGADPATYPIAYPAYAGQPWSSPPSVDRAPRRPRTVTVAVWLTWVFSILTLLVFGLLVLAMILDHEGLLSALQRDANVAALSLSGEEILAALWVVSAVCISWSLASIALAVLTIRGVGIARVALAVSAGLAGLVGFVAIPVGWLNAAAGIASAVLLFTGGANEWFAGRRRDDPPPAEPLAGSPPSAGSSSTGDKPPVW